MTLAAVVALVVALLVVAAYISYGRRLVRRQDDQKLQVLKSLPEGLVVLGLSGPRAIIHEWIGWARLDPRRHELAFQPTRGKSFSVPISQIRWVKTMEGEELGRW